MAQGRDKTPRMPLREFPEFRAHLAALKAQCEPFRCFVYLLADPREVSVVRYVGCSFHVYRRFLKHAAEARNPDWYSNGPKILFIQQCLLDGVLPECLLIEEVPGGRDRVRREWFWVNKFRSPELTNYLRPPWIDDGVRKESYSTRAGFWRHIQ